MSRLTRGMAAWLAAITITVFSCPGEAVEPPAPELSRLTLAGAEALWAEHSRELKLARTLVEGAEADVVTAGQRPNPQLSLNVNSLSTRPGIGGGHLRDKMMDTVIGLNQLIERGDKRELREEGARRRLEAAREDYTAARRGQLATLRQAYYDLLLAQTRRQVMEDTLAFYRKSVETGDLRHRAGDISRAELARLRVEALRAENDARQEENDLARARLALAYLIGREGEASRLVAVDAWPGVRSVEADMEAVLARRPDVRAAQARMAAAEAARNLARAQKTRDVSVGVQFEHNPTGSGYATNSYGVGVSIPLFLAHSYEGEIRRAEADLDNARWQYEQARAQALSSLAGVRGDLDAARERARRYDEGLLDEAERAARAAELAYRNGAVSLTDLLDARRTWRATQLDAAAARADYARALAAWHAATGDEEDTTP